MIEELLKAGKIERFHYLCFALFECNEFGREWYDKMLLDTFMEEPQGMDAGGIEFAFIDGKRTAFRDIRRALLFVKKQLKEAQNDNGN